MTDELSGLGKYFFFLLALEFAFGIYRTRNTFTTLDSINSLSTLALSSSMRLLMFPVELAIYFLVYKNFRIFTIEDSVVAFVAAFFVYDLCYYWRHRVGHEVNLFWAVHSVHHQSTEYNYTTSFRQRSFSFLTDWMFTLPMALAGFSLKAMIIGSAGNLAYQFWLHTRHVGRTPILDKVIVTGVTSRFVRQTTIWRT